MINDKIKYNDLLKYNSLFFIRIMTRGISAAYNTFEKTTTGKFSIVYLKIIEIAPVKLKYKDSRQTTNKISYQLCLLKSFKILVFINIKNVVKNRFSKSI